MSDFSFELASRSSEKPPFMVIYGPAGTGKTTLASQSEDNVFLPTEDGAGELVLNTLKEGVFASVDEFLAALRFVYANPEGIKTIIVDTLDHLEPLVWQKVCKDNGWDSIEAPGYGKGYIECDRVWMSIINALLNIRDDKNIAIVCLAHEMVRIVNDPQNGPYDAHELKMHKRAVALWKEKSDMIGLLKNTVVVDAKTGKGKGGTSPTLLVRPNAAYTAKTRYVKMPAMIPIAIETGWRDIVKHIPYYQSQPDDNKVEETA